MTDDSEKIIVLILVIFLPALAVYYKSRQCDVMVIIALILQFCFWIPGICFAAWFVYMRH
ncbi:hypothetical protein PRIPAC_96674 [Pristionchus pacificus]|uniref:Uncharacterized protein n=1 Tax=Pristionchus pacificus TaxID=54126 RepID=A0A2A6D1G6_PRIPA|nr:hypothetical protein PRIPAC_96674 [Pristionchus pacificus]|eukprot:PDM84218.1 hypothetical protein PRIPAC_33241 [Pristionchus pacificus]